MENVLIANKLEPRVQKGIKCSNFQNSLLLGLSSILHLQNIKTANGFARIYKSALVA